MQYETQYVLSVGQKYTSKMNKTKQNKTKQNETKCNEMKRREEKRKEKKRKTTNEMNDIKEERRVDVEGKRCCKTLRL